MVWARDGVTVGSKGYRVSVMVSVRVRLRARARVRLRVRLDGSNLGES